MPIIRVRGHRDGGYGRDVYFACGTAGRARLAGLGGQHDCATHDLSSTPGKDSLGCERAWSGRYSVSKFRCFRLANPCQGAVNPRRTIGGYAAREQLGMQDLSDDFQALY